MQVPPGQTLTIGVYELLATGTLGTDHRDHAATRRQAADVAPAHTSSLRLQSAYLTCTGM